MVNSVLVWKYVHEISDKVCKHFNLSYGKILPETRKRARHFGECRPCARCYNNDTVDEENCNEKILYIRINQLNKTQRPLATSTILRTLAHELAHLKYFKHGPQHRAFEREIVQFIKGIGYTEI